MTIPISKQLKDIARASKSGWKQFNSQLKANAENNLVSMSWNVTYDPKGHDIIIEAKIKVVNQEDYLLQLWLMDQHPGIWIPEFRPWVASVTEYQHSQKIVEAHIGLFDSKWSQEDFGETFEAVSWGYFSSDGEIKNYSETKEFIYPRKP